MNKLTRIFGKKKKSGSSYGAIVNTSNNDMPQTVSSSLMEVKESEAESTEVDLLMQELDADFTIMEVMGGLFMYFSVGICAYSFVFENWNIRDSIYFSVLTFTTIGKYSFITHTEHLNVESVTSSSNYSFFLSSIDYNRLWRYLPNDTLRKVIHSLIRLLWCCIDLRYCTRNC